MSRFQLLTTKFCKKESIVIIIPLNYLGFSSLITCSGEKIVTTDFTVGVFYIMVCLHGPPMKEIHTLIESID